MRVSCIIPTKDRRESTARAVDSVYGQQWPGIEIVVVDDGSSDGTTEALRARFSGVNFVRLSGEGPGRARNAGAAAARNDVLMFLDSDDIWLPGHVSALCETLDRGFSVAYGRTVTIDEVNCGSFCIPDDGHAVEGDCFRWLLRWCFLVPSAFSITRAAFEDAGGFAEGNIGEDWEFFLRVSERYFFGYAGQHPITRRYLHQGSLCSVNGGKGFLDALAMIEKTALQSGRVCSLERQRFQEVKKWGLRNSTNKRTVQEWFTAMMESGLLAERFR